VHITRSSRVGNLPAREFGYDLKPVSIQLVRVWASRVGSRFAAFLVRASSAILNESADV